MVHLNKIFKKDIALECLINFNPEKFGLRTNRCKKITYLGDDLWDDLLQIECNLIKEYVREYSISDKGKYGNIHNDLEYTKNTISRTKVLKEKSPCRPQQFSEQVVKPLMRKYLEEKMTEPINEYIQREMLEILTIHASERANQQLKADYSEYIIMVNCPNIIPTLKHTGGVDMYLLNDDSSIEELDIKTTRTIWGIEDPKSAIKKLYEEQDNDRFSCDTRLYIHLSDNEFPESEDILRQLNQKHDIVFQYGNNEFNVTGARLITV